MNEQPFPNSATVGQPDGATPISLRLAEQLLETKHGFDFRQFWHSLIERIWIVVLCVVAALFLAIGYLARTPKLYQGHIVLEVEFQEPTRSEEHTSELQSLRHLVCRLL